MRENSRTKNMAMMALMTAVICVLAPLSIPIGPVPISLTNLALAVILYILGTKKTLLSYLLYMIIGVIGIPVFSGFTGGPQKLLGPTGGYLLGFAFFVVIAGLVVDRGAEKRVRCFLAMVAGTAVVYLFGTAWLAYQAHLGFGAALAIGVIPFIWEDALKMVLAAVLGPVLRDRLVRAGVLQIATEKK